MILADDWKNMYEAIKRGELSLVRHYIERGVDPNFRHEEIKSTALVTAILSGHTEIAIFLLDHGADPTATSLAENLTPEEASQQAKDHTIAGRLNSAKLNRKHRSPDFFERLIMLFSARK